MTDADTRTSTLLSELEDTTLWLTLNRPEARNALSEELVGELRQHIADADEDRNVRVVVIRGAGPTFCAGGDFSAFKATRGVRETREYTESVFEMFSAIESCSKPVVAAVQGHALAGGADICLAADLVVAAEDACFGTPEAKIGLTAGFAGMRLPSIVGLHNAKYLLLTGRPIDADEAHRIGLVNIVCPSNRLIEVTRDVAVTLAANSPLGMAAGKAFLNRQAFNGVSHAIDMVTMLQMTEDRNEGLAAFREKRPPNFSGR